MDATTPVSFLTVGELTGIVEGIIERTLRDKAEADAAKASDQRNTVTGLAGIASIFGCSTREAQRIKKSEWIQPAITQVGRLIITDADKAMELARNRKTATAEPETTIIQSSHYKPRKKIVLK